MKALSIYEILNKKRAEIEAAINQFELELGVIDGISKPRDDEKDVNISNAELMFIHEYGSSIRHIPPRPVLHIALERSHDSSTAFGQLINKTLSKIIRHCFDYKIDEGYIKRELDILASRIQSMTKDIIEQGKDLKPLSDNNPRKKKDPAAVPLRDTGQLMRSIICRVVKKS